MAIETVYIYFVNSERALLDSRFRFHDNAMMLKMIMGGVIVIIVIFLIDTSGCYLRFGKYVELKLTEYR